MHLSTLILTPLRMLLPLLLLPLATLAVEEVSSTSYLSLSAAAKLGRVWRNCLSDTTSARQPSRLEGMVALLTERMCPTFRTPGDALPLQGPWWWRRRRPKAIHSVGSVGRVEWRSRGEHPYTGLFKGRTGKSARAFPEPKTQTENVCFNA